MLPLSFEHQEASFLKSSALDRSSLVLQVHCLSDICPHRGAPLSQGWVTEVKGQDCVVCPYHGWAFDAEGVLRDVPAADKAEAWPQKKLVDSYAVEEKVCL